MEVGEDLSVTSPATSRLCVVSKVGRVGGTDLWGDGRDGGHFRSSTVRDRGDSEGFDGLGDTVDRTISSFRVTRSRSGATVLSGVGRVVVSLYRCSSD